VVVLGIAVTVTVVVVTVTAVVVVDWVDPCVQEVLVTVVVYVPVELEGVLWDACQD